MKWPSWAHIPPASKWLPEPKKDKPTNHVACECCGELMHLKDAFVVTKKSNHQDLVYKFCNEECANIFYLERLRNAGL